MQPLHECWLIIFLTHCHKQIIWNILFPNGKYQIAICKENNELSYNLNPEALGNCKSSPLKAPVFTAASLLLMLSLELGGRSGQLAVNEFRAMKAAQGKHLCPLLFSLLSFAHLCSIHLLNVCGVRVAPPQPARLHFRPQQYLISTDTERLLPGRCFQPRDIITRRHQVLCWWLQAKILKS